MTTVMDHVLGPNKTRDHYRFRSHGVARCSGGDIGTSAVHVNGPLRRSLAIAPDVHVEGMHMPRAGKLPCGHG